MNRFAWIVGMVTSVAAAMVALQLPDPYHTYATLVFTVTGAMSGYMVQHPAPTWDGTERRARPSVPPAA